MSSKRDSYDEEISCPPKPQLQERPLISMERAAELETLFKVLGSRTRIRLLHALIRAGDLNVGELAEAVGMKPQAVSNQLQRLVDRGILASQRDGINIYYRIEDQCVVCLLDTGFCLLEEAKERVVAGVET